MTIPKGFDLFDLMAWLICACLAAVVIMGTVYGVLLLLVRIRALLEGPFG